jgi:hypothetical protein
MAYDFLSGLSQFKNQEAAVPAPFFGECKGLGLGDVTALLLVADCLDRSDQHLVAVVQFSVMAGNHIAVEADTVIFAAESLDVVLEEFSERGAFVTRNGSGKTATVIVYKFDVQH